MKRAAELRELSDDHHRSLVQARRLRSAASGETHDRVDAARAFLEFWRKETSAHFRKEEEVLLPVLARHGGDPASEPLVEMLAQHARIRGLVMQLSDEATVGDAPSETVRSIGELLEAHIRLEERRVFPMIEEILSTDALGEVASRLAAAEAVMDTEPRVQTEGLSSTVPGRDLAARGRRLGLI